MRPDPEIVIEESGEKLAAATAARVLATLATALTHRPVAHLVITGGSILEDVLELLAAPGARESVEWNRIHVWWGDERYVPADSEDRNDLPAYAKLFDHVDVDPAKMHRMPASDAGFGDDVQAAADSYAAELAASAAQDAPDGLPVPGFDVILLGVGPDGHCASLFPGHPGLDVMDAAVIAVHDSPKPPPTRLSLTFPTLDRAEEIWVIASGSGKADAVAKALGGGSPGEDMVPSGRPRGRRRTIWFLDRDAAARLPA